MEVVTITLKFKELCISSPNVSTVFGPQCKLFSVDTTDNFFANTGYLKSKCRHSAWPFLWLLTLFRHVCEGARASGGPGGYSHGRYKVYTERDKRQITNRRPEIVRWINQTAWKIFPNIFFAMSGFLQRYTALYPPKTERNLKLWNHLRVTPTSNPHHNSSNFYFVLFRITYEKTTTKKIPYLTFAARHHREGTATQK